MVLLGALVLAHAATPDAATYTIFNAPGAGTGSGQGTFSSSINKAGIITGYYRDSAAVAHGFVRKPAAR